MIEVCSRELSRAQRRAAHRHLLEARCTVTCNFRIPPMLSPETPKGDDCVRF